MDPQIVSAMIQASGTAIAAAIAAHALVRRSDIIKLAKEVAAYHEMEGKLVCKILTLKGIECNPNNVRHHRGRFRSEQMGDRAPKMAAMEAIRIRRKYLSFE